MWEDVGLILLGAIIALASSIITLLVQNKISPPPEGMVEFKRWPRGAYHLYKVMGNRFDIDDVKETCFHTHIDYEELPGETKRAKVRELIAHCVRHNRFDELVQEVEKVRPGLLDEPVVAARLPEMSAPGSGSAPSDRFFLPYQVGVITFIAYLIIVFS